MNFIVFLSRIPKIRLPLEPAHLYSIYKALDLSNIQNTIFWALLLIGFYGMLRKSQFANNSRNTFNPKEQLTRGDFQWTSPKLCKCCIDVPVQEVVVSSEYMYLVFPHLIMSSLVLVNKILRHQILTVLSMF
jgi:hypothetical protein